MRIKISFDEKIKKGPKEKRISPKPSYRQLLATPPHTSLQG
jgi:hypothetical protein